MERIKNRSRTMIYLKEYYNYDDQVAEICKKFGIENWSIRDGLVDVDGNVGLWNIGLTKLPLKFGRVSGYFDCENNNLTTLEGSPKEVGGDFSCYDNNLTTLEGAPKEVSGNFWCSNNKLTSLEGAPKEVGGNFWCRNNNLTTLDYMPNVRGDIYINNNPLPKEILNLPKDKLKDVIFEQDFYEIWRDGNLFLPRWKELKIDLGL
jgi:hypothetical protein